MDWVRTSGDQVHSLYAQLSDVNGGLDIPLGTIVLFAGHLLGQDVDSIGGAGVVVRADAEVDDPNRGFVRYDLSTSDTSAPGIYYCQWRLTPPGSSQTQRFPEDGNMLLMLLPAA